MRLAVHDSLLLPAVRMRWTCARTAQAHCPLQLLMPAPVGAPTQIVLYCGPGSNAVDMCEDVAARFNLNVAPNFEVRAGG